MRTTLTLDDDILKEAAKRAKEFKIPLGKAVSDLVRRGLQAAPPVKQANGLVVFDPAEGSPRITMRKVVRDALSDFP
jgi:hypothetical protein